jgi:hypothetical protein
VRICRRLQKSRKPQIQCHSKGPAPVSSNGLYFTRGMYCEYYGHKPKISTMTCVKAEGHQVQTTETDCLFEPFVINYQDRHTVYTCHCQECTELCSVSVLGSVAVWEIKHIIKEAFLRKPPSLKTL